jgi:hypothetical protein
VQKSDVNRKYIALRQGIGVYSQECNKGGPLHAPNAK